MVKGLLELNMLKLSFREGVVLRKVLLPLLVAGLL